MVYLSIVGLPRLPLEKRPLNGCSNNLLPPPRRLCFCRCLSVCLSVSLSVCLFVCLLATLRQKARTRTDLHEIFRKGWQWANEQMLNFGGDPDHRLDTGIVFRIRHYW